MHSFANMGKNLDDVIYKLPLPPPKKKQQQINQQSYEKKKKYKMPNFRTLKPDAKNDQCVMKKKMKK